jgi:hypothetical protein
MSCYARHLDEFLPPTPSPDDRRALDGAVRVYLGMSSAECPDVWAAVKERRDDPAFADGVRAAMRENG